MSHAGHLPAVGADQLHVAGVQCALTLDDPAFDIALRVRTRVALDHVHAFNDQAVLERQYLEHAPTLAGILPRRNDDGVVAANWCLQLRHDLQNLWRERNDLHEPALAQLTGDGPEHARADRLVLIVHQHRRVAIEANVAAVAAAMLFPCPHDHGLDDLALLHRAIRRGFLDRGGDDVTEPRVASGGPADRVDHRDLARAGVVGHVEDRAHLDHGWLLYCFGFRHHPRHDPPLAARERPRFGNRDRVTDLGLILLVVGDELRRLALRLAVDVVTHLALDGHDHGLVHLVADHRAGDLCLDAHFSPTVFSRRIVLIRARSRRTPRTLAGASSCPIDFWIRSRNNWSSRSFSRCRSSSTPSSRTSPAFMMLSPARSAPQTSS